MKVAHVAALVAVLSACGGATPPPETAPPPVGSAPPAPARTPSPPPDVPDTRTAPHASEAKTTGRAPPPGEEETRTMTASQCKTLEAIVGGLVHKEALAKIDPKLSPELRQKAENGAVDAARSVSESFRDSCLDNFVGKPIRRETLDCMLKARDFAAFGACNK